MAKAFEAINNWYTALGWKVFPFQKQCWQAYQEGKHGLLIAPTGSGKTYAMLLGILEEQLHQKKEAHGLQIIWITPIRALAEEIRLATERAFKGLDLNWTVAVRSGDTSTAERAKQSKDMPHVLITTPESLQLLLAQKDYAKRLSSLKCIVLDEWHELVGNKRGVQMELALSRLKQIAPYMRIWGISATLGNLEEARQVLLGDYYEDKAHVLIHADIKKTIQLITILPKSVDQLPWSGHIGMRMLKQVIPLIEQSESCLIFTNTRAQAEIWYKQLLDEAPDLAGLLALHHSSMSKDLRQWVEAALHEGKLKAVVCTSSLDLGVDFRPVDTIIQIGSPKGVARFIQRAGRSGHQPGASSKIYFLPTNSLELIEAAALRKAIDEKIIEPRPPYTRCFDVLAQYLVTLAISDGFKKEEMYREVTSCFCFQSMTQQEFQWVLNYICTGGEPLKAYDEFHKVVVEDGIYKVVNRRIAMRHRLSIGTIVSDAMLRVTYMNGSFLGHIEESFISKLRPGDAFWFAGRFVELGSVNAMQALVRKTNKKSGPIPSWMGGRLSLSAQLGNLLREKLHEAYYSAPKDAELKFIKPLLQLQAEHSIIPSTDELLVEQFESEEGYHIILYPFEGRLVHLVLASLLAYRLAQKKPISFSLSANDYGLELLSDKQAEITAAGIHEMLSPTDLLRDIQAAINASELAAGKFRDIAVIAGLVFQGMPGKAVKEKHIKSSTQLIFKVLMENDEGNLLLNQAFEEAFTYQVEETRLRECLLRLSKSTIRIKHLKVPGPLAFPIMVDRLRQQLSSESLEDRVKRMQLNMK
jgi:ATP-dependent Lhr-like helicase